MRDRQFQLLVLLGFFALVWPERAFLRWTFGLCAGLYALEESVDMVTDLLRDWRARRRHA
jgi:hypothetical protein